MTNQAAIAKANQAVATQNIQAAHPPMTEEEKLTARWRTAKKAVQAAQDHLLAIEVEIWNHEKHRLPPKGTTTLDTGLKIVTGFTEKWDQESLNKAYQGWEAPVPFPFKGEWKPDGKAISYLQQNLPEHYRTLQDALTISEKKPSFSMKTE